jgi:stress-induced morphogen
MTGDIAICVTWRPDYPDAAGAPQESSPMAMDANEIERLIRARIPDADVTIRDLAGDGDHYAATVIAESFRGKSRVQQHQIVYEALKGEMGGKLHALALQTGTPER